MVRNKHPKICFQHTPLHKRWEPHALTYLIQRSSFWIATFSVSAFLVGNMIGQHGWYAFWKSVVGRGAEAYITYTGTVTPIELVPDYMQWSTRYGGDPHEHTYRQVPQSVLVPLPTYRSSVQANHKETSPIGQIYSVGYNGSYATGGEHDGSHPGIDIRVPIGTPVRAMANGIVEEAKVSTGFGKVIVVVHPNVPDPANPKETTTLYSSYAHLSAMYVEVGAVVKKGEQIGLTGYTGYASGPHLHFQIDRSEAPWHPYWPFTSGEASRAHMTIDQAVSAGLHSERVLENTVHPMLYVQANYPSLDPEIVIVRADPEEPEVTAPVVKTAPPSRETLISRAQSRREERLRSRLSRRRFAEETPVPVPPVPVEVVKKDEIVSADPTVVPSPASKEVHTVSISHDGSFAGRGWETVKIILLDKEGNVVRNPDFKKDVYMRLAYGLAEFRPVVLKEQHFVNGVATIRMLPRGRRTVVIQVQPYGVMSKPMVYK